MDEEKAVQAQQLKEIKRRMTENNNSYLSQIQKFSAVNLKPTVTRITYMDGRQFVKYGTDGEEREVSDATGAVDDNENKNESNVMYWSRKCGYLVDLVPDMSISEILPRLYLSGDDPATDREALRSKGITHVVNLTTNIENKFEDIVYVKFVIYDLPSQKINDVFAEACRFIDTALTVNNANAVLVHCNAGVSRSTTIVIAYLLHKRMFKKYKDALDHVKAKRAVANPNSGFVEQLVQFEKQLNSSS